MQYEDEVVYDPNPDVHALQKELCEVKSTLMETEWKLELYKEWLHDELKEKPKGKWEWVQYDANPNIGNWHCSNCNYINKCDCVTDFCPSCGADLRDKT